jgi:hypothetical protein
VQSASIRTPLPFANPARCSPDSRDPKLVARRNYKFFSHFRLIGRSASRALARVPILVRKADCHWKTMPQSQKLSLAHKSRAAVYDLSAMVYCI